MAHTCRPGSVGTMANELGNYLRTLRGMVSPAQVGLPDTGRRRVPGLRRGELSQLVGLSTEYYGRLEQGRAERPSPAVLSAISRVLQLDPAQRAHLFDLARHPRVVVPRKAEPIRAGLDHVVAGIVDCPALLVNRGLDVLAWNELATLVIADFDRLPVRDRNMARQVFLAPDARQRHADWAHAARDTVGMLRLSVRRPPVENSLVELVDELLERSPAFGELWQTHYVYEKTHGAKAFHHPAVGTIDLRYETFHVAGQEQHMLVVYAAEPGSAAEAGLRRLRQLRSTGTGRSSTVERVVQLADLVNRNPNGVSVA